jgi:hypothetical protein
VALGATNPPFIGAQVAFAGNLAVVVSGSAGLTTVDVSNPQAPAAMGVLTLANTGFQKVAMAGRYAYVILGVSGNPGHFDLAVVDVLVPQTPTIVGRITVGGGGGVRVVGSVVYVAATTTGLQLVDVTDPTAPTIVITIDTPGSARDVAVANGYAYVADNTAVQVIDVHVPANASIVGSLPVTAVFAAVSGSRLYVLDSSLLKVIDVSNAMAPALLGSTTNYSAKGLDAAGNLVYLASASSTQGGLYILDAS